MAYYEPMRKEEIIGLTWDEIDLQSNFIRLSANRTKGKKNGRSIPIHPLIKEMLYSLPRSITTNRVFLYLDKQGRYRPFKGFSRSWNRVRKLAGLNDVVFHDLRHTAITNMRKAGNPPSVIMKASGHKTMSMFLRYNLQNILNLLCLYIINNNCLYNNTCTISYEWTYSKIDQFIHVLFRSYTQDRHSIVG